MTQDEFTKFIVSGMWGYDDLPEGNAFIPTPYNQQVGGFYYPYEFGFRLSIYFYIDPKFVLTFRGLNESDPLECPQ
jgi:hypothetical protein